MLKDNSGLKGANDISFEIISDRPSTNSFQVISHISSEYIQVPSLSISNTLSPQNSNQQNNEFVVVDTPSIQGSPEINPSSDISLVVVP